MKLRILIADDHKMFRHALKMTLEREPNFEVVGEAGDGQELLKIAHRAHPQLVCMDVAMPVMDGIEATRRLLAIKPDIKVIGLSGSSDQYYATELMKAGAYGYVTKTESVEEIMRAINAVHYDHKKYLCPDIAAYVMESLSKGHAPDSPEAALSYRERQVLKLVAEGYTSMHIAELLHITSATVEVHRRNIMSKLGLHSIATLTRYAIRHGIIVN